MHDDVPVHDSSEPMTDELLLSVVQRLREPVAASAGFDQWIMTEIRAGDAKEHQDQSARARTRSWVSRHVEWLATGALLTIAVATIIILRATVHVSDVHPHIRTASIPVAPTRPAVRFAFTAPDAHTVTVVGTFNGWDTHATPLHRDDAGVWSADIPLEPGRYAYLFVVDGQRWVLDPSAARDAADDFGTRNSVVMVASAARE